MPKQLDIDIPQATYQIRVWCKDCTHPADMSVGIEVVDNLDRLKCGYCGGKNISFDGC